jgi:hypothetical protein
MSHSSVITTDQTEPSISAIWGIIVLTVVILTATLLGSYLMFNTTVSMELNNKEMNSIPQSVLKIRAYESESLHSLKWISKADKTVQIPLSLAKELVLEAYAQ